jgi:hypothetical protein
MIEADPVVRVWSGDRGLVAEGGKVERDSSHRAGSDESPSRVTVETARELVATAAQLVARSKDLSDRSRLLTRQRRAQDC